jgi:SAM-dependent methyltransferase
MRRDVLDLRQFYASPLGRTARTLLSRRLVEAWGPAARLDVMGFGYATPYLDVFRERARRVVAVMPASQGVEVWPNGEMGLSCLSDDRGLPFPNALFDRILLVHALEEADDPLGLLRETWRVLAPSGRVIVVAANRHGFWSDSESTPFGHGRPFSHRQLEVLMREAELEPVAWSRALFAPPFDWTARWSETFERIGARLWPPLSGVVLLEAVKQTFAVKPKGRKARVRVFAPGVLQPAPVGKARKSAAPHDRDQNDAFATRGDRLA